MTIQKTLEAFSAFAGSLTEPSFGLEAVDSPTGVKYATLREAFEEAAGDVVGSVKLAKAVISYSKNIATKNDDHIRFFGGNLLGVERIKFLDADRNRWFDEVLGVDEEYLRECVHSTNYLNIDWKVASDPFNLSCIWVIHRLLTSPIAADKLAHEAMVEAAVVLQFKFYTSIWYNFFSKPTDQDAAEATYAALTLKFALKQLGSWGALMRDRGERLVAPDSIRYKPLKQFADDMAVTRIITDMQTRSKGTIIDMYGVLDNVRRGNLRIQSTSSTMMSLDGDKIIKDQVSTYNTARYYLLDVSGNPSSFIKRDLIDVVLKLMTSVSENAFISLLQVIATMPEGKGRQECEWMMENTLMHAFDYIAKNRVRFNDVGAILIKMKALYMSSKTTDPLLLELRSRIEKFVKKNSHLRSSAALASARSSLMLYFLLRALASNQYK